MTGVFITSNPIVWKQLNENQSCKTSEIIFFITRTRRNFEDNDLIMGDVNYLFHSIRKTNALKMHLNQLQIYCEVIKQHLDEHEYSFDEEICGLTVLMDLYEKRLSCLERLKLLMNSRINFLTNQ